MFFNSMRYYEHLCKRKMPNLDSKYWPWQYVRDNLSTAVFPQYHRSFTLVVTGLYRYLEFGNLVLLRGSALPFFPTGRSRNKQGLLCTYGYLTEAFSPFQPEDIVKALEVGEWVPWLTMNPFFPAWGLELQIFRWGGIIFTGLLPGGQ